MSIVLFKKVLQLVLLANCLMTVLLLFCCTWQTQLFLRLFFALNLSQKWNNVSSLLHKHSSKAHAHIMHHAHKDFCSILGVCQLLVETTKLNW